MSQDRDARVAAISNPSEGMPTGSETFKEAYDKQRWRSSTAEPTTSTQID